ncbi:MAG: hypothetical protein H0X54_05040 [Propionibacteriales bacterium]|nr:hypothetical protein [Propionibacteriales bacterium]
MSCRRSTPYALRRRSTKDITAAMSATSIRTKPATKTTPIVGPPTAKGFSPPMNALPTPGPNAHPGAASAKPLKIQPIGFSG